MRRRWVAAAAAVLLISGCTSTVEGAVGSDPAPTPSPTPSWTPGTVVPSVAVCPTGSTPDSPAIGGSSGRQWGQAAVDAQSGRLVVVESGVGFGHARAAIESFDVCTNTWRLQRPAHRGRTVSWGGPAVVYDPGTDAILALTVSETRPTRVTTYSSATHQAVEGILPQKLLPWAYSVDTDKWALLPTMAFPPGFESASLTHAALDPTTRAGAVPDGGCRFPDAVVLQPRMADAHATGWAGPRRTIRRSGADPRCEGASPGPGPVGLLPPRSRVRPGPSTCSARSGRTSRATPPDLPFEESSGSAWSPVARPRSIRSRSGRSSSWAASWRAYQTGSHQWDAVYPGPGWPSKVRLLDDGGRRARRSPWRGHGHSLVYDPVNQRMLVYGGTWQTTKGEMRTGDVWAYDVPTNTWTELVRPTTQQQ